MAVFLLVALCLFGLVPRLEAVELSSVKVVSLYESILDADAQDLTRILAETGTEVVFRGFFRWGRDELWAGENLYPRLATRISEIKARLPWIHIMGAITSAAFVDGDHWPNGTVVSAEEKRQMLWTLPNDTMPRHFADPSRSYILDISKPLARRFILEYAYKLIDAGFDSLWFDEIQFIPANSNWMVKKQIPERAYVDGWKQIASSVKDYSRTRFGRELPVSLNNGWVNAKGDPWRAADPWPYQDFISIGVSFKTAETQSIQDDWTGYKAQTRKVYGRLPPMMVFLDWGKPPTPLSIFGNLPVEGQIRMLKLLHETALREGMLFVYPLHGGVISEYLSPPYNYVVYDARQQGTYDAIRQLTTGLVRVYSQTVTSTLTRTVTEDRTSTVTGILGITSSSLAVLVVIFLSGAAVGILAMNLKRRK